MYGTPLPPFYTHPHPHPRKTTHIWVLLLLLPQVITRHGFHIVAVLCEVVLFVYAGLDMWVTALW